MKRPLRLNFLSCEGRRALDFSEWRDTVDAGLWRILFPGCGYMMHDSDEDQRLRCIVIALGDIRSNGCKTKVV